MKRAICLILALLMCFALFSCGEKAVQGNLPVVFAKNGVGANAKQRIDLATVWNGTLEHPDVEGFYDPDYDYSANPRYEVCLFGEGVVVNDLHLAAFTRLCDAMNIEFIGYFNPESNLAKADEQLRELAREYDGIILTSDYGYTDVLDEEGCPWIYWTYASRDENGMLKSPAAIYSYDGVGAKLADNAVSYYEENLSDIPVSQIGVMYITFSGSTLQNDRVAEFKERISSIAPELAENVLVHDMDAGPVAVDRVTFDEWYDQFLEDNTQFDYWLCCGIGISDVFDAADAFLRHGLQDNVSMFTGVMSPEVVFGEEGIPMVVSCCAVPYVLQVEPVIGALYGFMTGDLDPGTIWGGNENSCGSITVDQWVTVTRENYPDYQLKLEEYMS